jgi:HPt (histidine-containing phosphotransfer) domain-containing protein
MKEMFLKNGFNDFLPKPIEIPKMDEIVTKWIPGKKKKAPEEWDDGQAKPGGAASVRPTDSERPFSIEGVNVPMGIALTGGSEAGYRNVLSVLYTDIQNRMPDFEKLAGKLAGKPEGPPLEPEESAAFAIQAHALKSALATVGAPELSQSAAALETAGKGMDRRFIAENLPAFIRDLKTFNGKIRAAAPPPEEAPDRVRNTAILIPALEGLRAALLGYNVGRIDTIMKQLEAEAQLTPDESARLSEYILMGDYEEAAELAGELLLQNQKNG